MGGFFFGGKGDLGLLVIYVPFFLFWFRRIVTDSISSAAKGRPSQGRKIVRTVKPRVFIYKSGVRIGYRSRCRVPPPWSPSVESILLTASGGLGKANCKSTADPLRRSGWGQS